MASATSPDPSAAGRPTGQSSVALVGDPPLQKAKRDWDPLNSFHHTLSVRAADD
ncbi:MULTISPECIES: BBE domain-containing protein [Prauserella]|uniref:BBE domain-containing protein n=1 Tax=Prauserella TaxID=142577 RepID=UPI00130516E4|nr:MULTISPECIES: BBE domain-containing protein [Prauserella]